MKTHTLYYYYYHTVSPKNVTTLSCYNSDIHEIDFDTLWHRYNICAKNYQKRFVYVRVIDRQSSDIFWGDTVYYLIKVKNIYVSKDKFSSTFDVSKYASMQSTNCSAYNKSTRVTQHCSPCVTAKSEKKKITKNF